MTGGDCMVENERVFHDTFLNDEGKVVPSLCPRPDYFRVSRGRVEIIRMGEIEGFASDGGTPYLAGVLPVEFFNHQVFEADLSSAEGLRLFLQEWGFPFSPMRNKRLCLRNNAILEEECFQGIEDSESLRKEGYGGELYRPISFREARGTIEALREAVVQLRKAIQTPWRDGGDEQFHDVFQYEQFINAALRAPLVFYETWSAEDTNLEACGGLTSAICNQIAETIKDERPWRKCKAEGCDVIFKRRQSNGKLGVPSPSRLTSEYCCKKCATRMAKRAERKRGRGENGENKR